MKIAVEENKRQSYFDLSMMNILERISWNGRRIFSHLTPIKINSKQ